MNLNNEVQRERLFRAMKESWRHLEPFRALTTKLVEEYVGPEYGKDRRAKYENVVNLINQAVDSYTMSLAANRPRVLITTRHENLAYYARHFQLAMNNLIEEIELETTIRQCVMDAFFCLGVAKVHMADSVPVMIEAGLWMDPGTPFVSSVSIENWCHDMSAQKWHKIKYAADSYRVPFSDLKSDIFDQAVVKQLSPSSKLGSEDRDRMDRIASGSETDDDEVEPMIDLMDVWLPREGRIATFAMDSKDRFSSRSRPLAEMSWEGDEKGPYHILSYNDVPQNTMPTPPAAHLAVLARLVNNLLRKQKRQARSYKKINTYRPGAEESAEEIRRAGDGDWVKVEDPSEIGQVESGGVNPVTQAFVGEMIELFDRQAGNLSARGGLGPQAETYGQEKLIYGAVSKKDAQMQYRTNAFVNGVAKALGRFLWDDVVKVIPGRMEVEGADGFAVDATWEPGDREGSFEDYDMAIDVYSMSYQSPASRIQALNQLLTQIYAPLMPVMLSQGGSINIQKLTEIYADLLNLPRLKQIVQFADVVPELQSPDAGGKPANTTRTYERKNVPTGGTQASRALTRQSQWTDMAGQATPQQLAALGA